MFEFLPVYFVPVWAFIFGVVIGSFLNVFIYRFHTGKSLAGSSHCLSCTTPLRWFELFPLLSYVGLRARCRTCSAKIPLRYFAVELVTGLLFSAATFATNDILLWPVLFFLVATLVVVSVYDLYHFVIPNEFVWTLAVVAVIIGGYRYYVTGDYLTTLYSILAAGLGFSFFAGLWWYSGGRWLGFGDAKLAIPLSFMVGIGGVFSMLVLSFWIGTVISLFVMMVQRYSRGGQLRLRLGAPGLTIKSEVPFAPFLILGFLAVYFGGVDVLDFFSYAFY